MSTNLQPVRHSQSFLGVAPKFVYQTLTDFESYPSFFKEIQAASVLHRHGPTVRVEFHVPMMLPVRYVLDLTCDPDALTIQWTFVAGDIVIDNHGAWRVAAEGTGSKIDYEVTLSVKAPVPGFVLRKLTDTLVSASLPGMFRALQAEASRRQSQT